MRIKWSRSSIKDIHQKRQHIRLIVFVFLRALRLEDICVSVSAIGISCRPDVYCTVYEMNREYYRAFGSNEKKRRTNGRRPKSHHQNSPICSRNNAKYDSVSHDIYLSKVTRWKWKWFVRSFVRSVVWSVCK